MSVYTKTGDKGETSLYSKDQIVRISKSADLIEVIGTVDEVNSFLGICITLLANKKLKKILTSQQKNLFTIGAILAGAKLKFTASKTQLLESYIDSWDGSLPVLKNFILPGGESAASHLFYARTLVRKLERRLVGYSQTQKVHPEILKYINRLSDFVFVLARFVNFSSHTPEENWRG